MPQQEEMQVLVAQEVEEETILQHLHLLQHQERQELLTEVAVVVELQQQVQMHLIQKVQEEMVVQEQQHILQEVQ